MPLPPLSLARTADEIIRDYRVHGLILRLDDELPGAVDTTGAGPPDLLVHVRSRPAWGDAPLDRSRILWPPGSGGGTSAMRTAGVLQGGAGTRIEFVEGATFWIAQALDEIWLDFAAPLTGRDAAYFLFEPVLAFVLRCRGTLVLHASAVAIDGCAVLFCGEAGSGKSTNAAALVGAGHHLLSDDILALERHGSAWRAHRGTNAIRLWEEGASAAGFDGAELAPFSPTWAKGIVPAPAPPGTPDPVPLALVCVLGDHDAGDDAPRLQRVEGALALRRLLVHTAGNRLHDSVRRAQELPQLAELVREVPIALLAGHVDSARLTDLVGRMVAAARA